VGGGGAVASSRLSSLREVMPTLGENLAEVVGDGVLANEQARADSEKCQREQTLHSARLISVTSVFGFDGSL
jgi:hypothetical protein